jgi:2-hydroxycyclohexanecarboxyl-CoA dehydrogenase
MMNLKGKIAVVTGGASGIGRETVLSLARSGANVFSGDIDTAGHNKTAQLAEQCIGSVHPFNLDVADRESVRSFSIKVFESMENSSSAVDIIVNVAGWDKMQPFLDADPEFMDKIIAINLIGPMNMVSAFLPRMVAVNKGKIINVASDAGRVGSMGETVYSGAKGGVIAFTKSLARETARHKINVNCVCPGPTNTPLLLAQPEAVREKLVKAIPFRRIGEPEEVADAILFFASGMSDYITGQVLSVSGGLTMAD